MCDHTNAQTIVEEMLHYLEKADYSIRETLVYMLFDDNYITSLVEIYFSETVKGKGIEA